jgi:hypothetical protein
VWFVYARSANGMPGRDSTKVKGVNAGRKREIATNSVAKAVHCVPGGWSLRH